MRHHRINTIILTCCMTFGMALAMSANSQQRSRLETGFRTPPADCRPYTWWHWQRGDVNPKMFQPELESLKRAGIGGVLLFDVGQTGPKPLGEPLEYLSDKWLDYWRQVCETGNELGLKTGAHNCSGWSSTGGEWITPEMSMKQLVWTETTVTGPAEFAEKLPSPEAKLGFYRDIRVIAWPKLTEEERIPQWQYKAYHDEDIKNYHIKETVARWQARNPNPGTSENLIDPRKLIDLTDKMEQDGVLHWSVPAGKWTILRLGHTSDEKMVRNGTGLECDKLDASAVEFHWKNCNRKMMDAAGVLAGEGRTFNMLEIDSYEVGWQNWTHDFPREFKRRRSYELWPYLPCLTGRVVDSDVISERFLYDLRLTVSELFRENYARRFAELCRKNNMTPIIEPHFTPSNEFDVGSEFVIVMSEIWDEIPFETSQHLRYSTYKCASMAHTTGKNIVACETFTCRLPESRWRDDWRRWKRYADLVFLQGANLLIYHTSTHQPYGKTSAPGLGMGQHGFHCNYLNTWWEQFHAFNTYAARCQFLLRQGKHVADICVFGGEEPYLEPDRCNLHGTEGSSRIPYGYCFDWCGPSVLLDSKAKDSRMVTQGGAAYRLLIVDYERPMRPVFWKKLAELAAGGVAVVVKRIPGSPSLEDYPKGDEEVKKHQDKLFATGNAFEQPALEVIANRKLQPDFSINSADDHILFIHRQDDKSDIYYIGNQKEEPVSTTAKFRVAGKRPELWDPVTGQCRRVPVYRVKDGFTEIPIHLPPAGAIFVVFTPDNQSPPALAFTDPAGKPVSENRAMLQVNDAGGLSILARQSGTYQVKTADGEVHTIQVGVPTSRELDGPWKVTFEPDRGAPESAIFDKLISWTEHDNAEIKYFSGHATYHKEFQLNEQSNPEKQHVVLDLGNVGMLAEVKLNDQNLGVVWTDPFEVDVTEHLKEGSNQLEITVVNSWRNRVIGDDVLYPRDAEYGGYDGTFLVKWPDWLVKGQSRPTKRVTLPGIIVPEKERTLTPSGLMGPVTLRPVTVKAISPENGINNKGIHKQ